MNAINYGMGCGTAVGVYSITEKSESEGQFKAESKSPAECLNGSIQAARPRRVRSARSDIGTGGTG